MTQEVSADRAGDTLFDPVSLIRFPGAVPSLYLRVIGLPAPQGSKKAFRNQFTGRIQQVENSQAVAPWRERVERAAIEQCCEDGMPGQLAKGFPLSGPLIAEMVFTMPKPAAAPKRKRTWPATHRNDVSKLARSTEDALVTSGAILDDGLIVEYVRLAKVFREDRDGLDVPGAVIRIWQMDDLVEQCEGRGTILPKD